MHLDEHPFRLLGIGTRTKKSEILDRARSLELTHDQERIQSAKAIAIHPTKRIDAEVSWFIGVRPARLTQVLSAIEHDELPTDLEHVFSGLDGLTNLNVLYFWLIRCSSVNQDTWVVALEMCATYATDIVAANVIEALNADRIAAGIPQIVDIKSTDDALARWKEEIVGSLVSHLIKRESQESVISHLVDKSTLSGTNFANDFIYRLVDRYQLAIQQDLGLVQDQIHVVCAEMAQEAATGEIGAGKWSDLETLVRRWNELTAGIQLAMKSRGLEDPMTITLIQHVRSMSIDIAKEHARFVEARRITLLLQDASNHTPTLMETFSSDLETLDRLIAQKTERDSASAAVNSLVDVCLTVQVECRTHIIREEGSADLNGDVCRKALGRFRDEIGPALRRLPPDEKGIRRAHEAAALCLSIIAVEYTWADCFVTSEELQIEALQLAEAAEGMAEETWTSPSLDSSASKAIRDSLEKVRGDAHRQRLMAAMTPISSAPSLSTFNTLGFAVYGKSDYDAETSSYVTTHYFVVLFLPLFPLARYRVVNLGAKGYRFLGKLPLRKADRWHLAIAAILVLIVIIAGAVSSSPTNSHSTVSSPGNSAQLESLKAQINTGRSALSPLELKLKPVLAQLKTLKGTVDQLDSQLKMLEVQRQGGIDIDVNNYNSTVQSYNSVLQQYNDLYDANAADLQKYDDLTKKDDALVEQYNTLIKGNNR